MSLADLAAATGLAVSRIGNYRTGLRLMKPWDAKVIRIEGSPRPAAARACRRAPGPARTGRAGSATRTAGRTARGGTQ